MDLVNTDVEIRERSLPQRIDMTLRFIATRAPGVFLYSALGVGPAMIGNALLLWALDPFAAWNNLSWLWNWALITYLIWVESPLVMAPLVVFLGTSLFRQPISLRFAVREIWRNTGRQLFVHGVVRTHLLWSGLALLSYATLTEGLLAFSLTLGAMFVMVFWCFRPYVDQIIYLERLPLVFKSEHPMTVGKRSSMLHGSDSGGVMLESITNFLLAFVVFFATYGLLLWGYYWLTFNTVTQGWFGSTLFALALWFTMIVGTVLRFFSYLDSRIRSEGWELELRLRREADLQARAGVGQSKLAVAQVPTAATAGGGQR